MHIKKTKIQIVFTIGKFNDWIIHSQTNTILAIMANRDLSTIKKLKTYLPDGARHEYSFWWTCTIDAEVGKFIDQKLELKKGDIGRYFCLEPMAPMLEIITYGISGIWGYFAHTLISTLPVRNRIYHYSFGKTNVIFVDGYPGFPAEKICPYWNCRNITSFSHTST